LNEDKVDDLKPFGHEELAAEFFLVMKMYDIPKFSIIDLIDKGLSLDLTPPCFQTPLDLESYCYGVAGTVGIACLPIFGVPWAEAKNFAVRLGVGIQWINVVRDVGVDAKLGRVYLPLDHLEEFHCTAEEIINRRNSERLKALLSYEANVARTHYVRAMEMLPLQWRKELLPARMMGEIYLKLLTKIERKGFPIFEKKVTLNPLEKITSAIRTYWTSKK
jgi:phytoene synthase